jgi:hypothetical protein
MMLINANIPENRVNCLMPQCGRASGSFNGFPPTGLPKQIVEFVYMVQAGFPGYYEKARQLSRTDYHDFSARRATLAMIKSLYV